MMRHNEMAVLIFHSNVCVSPILFSLSKLISHGRITPCFLFNLFTPKKQFIADFLYSMQISCIHTHLNSLKVSNYINKYRAHESIGLRALHQTYQGPSLMERKNKTKIIILLDIYIYNKIFFLYFDNW